MSLGSQVPIQLQKYQPSVDAGVAVNQLSTLYQGLFLASSRIYSKGIKNFSYSVFMNSSCYIPEGITYIELLISDLKCKNQKEKSYKIYSVC